MLSYSCDILLINKLTKEYFASTDVKYEALRPRLITFNITTFKACKHFFYKKN